MARVLVTLDGSAAAEQALAPALLRLRPDDELVLLRVLHPLNLATHWALQLQDRLRQEAQLYLDERARGLCARGLAPATVLRVGAPAEEIVCEARDRHADLLFMATYGTGGYLLGSVAGRVARAAPCPVWLVRPDVEPDRAGPNTILIPLDGSEVGLKGLDFVRAWVRRETARLLIMTSMDQTTGEDASEPERDLRQRAGDLRAAGWQVEWKVCAGLAAEAILTEAAAHDANLIVLGTCGVPAWLGGRVAERVLEKACCPVVLVNPGAALPEAVWW